jgi:uncharacterized membrane protein
MREKSKSNDIKSGAGGAAAKSKQKIMFVALSGVFAALIFVATAVTKTQVGQGYFNLGDGVILTCAYLLGPIAFFPAAIGSALADLMVGAAPYIPATFVIKGAMGLLAGWIMRKEPVAFPAKLIALVLAEIIMVAGYFGFESLPFMYGPTVALAQLIPNALQGVVGIAVALILTGLLKSLRTRMVEGKKRA